jgi:hypothetical protein
MLIGLPASDNASTPYHMGIQCEMHPLGTTMKATCLSHTSPQLQPCHQKTLPERYQRHRGGGTVWQSSYMSDLWTVTVHTRGTMARQELKLPYINKVAQTAAS